MTEDFDDVPPVTRTLMMTSFVLLEERYVDYMLTNKRWGANWLRPTLMTEGDLQTEMTEGDLQ